MTFSKGEHGSSMLTLCCDAVRLCYIACNAVVVFMREPTKYSIGHRNTIQHIFLFE